MEITDRSGVCIKIKVRIIGANREVDVSHPRTGLNSGANEQ